MLDRLDEKIKAEERALERLKIQVLQSEDRLRELRLQRSREIRIRYYEANIVTGQSRGVESELVHTRGLLSEAIQTYMQQEGAGWQVMLSSRSGVSTRTIRRIISGENKYATFDTADRLLTAMDQQSLSRQLDIISIGEVSTPRRYRGDPESQTVHRAVRSDDAPGADSLPRTTEP